MIAAELREGDKPSLNEALGWIGSRVDDIYGANVGRLEDVWIDPGTGVPRWLLVKEGRFGGRTTLIPFEDATVGVGHVWVPYEREVVREAPEIEPGAPLTHQVEASLRSHYAANAPAAISHRDQPAPEPGRQPGGIPREEPRPEPDHPAPTQAVGFPPVQLPARPAPPIAAPREDPQPPAEPWQGSPASQGQAPWQGQAPAPAAGPPTTQPDQPAYAPQQQPGWQVPPQQPPPEPEPAPAPAQTSIDALRDLAASPDVHYVEIELSGELSIRGELRSVRVVPRDRRPAQGR